MILRTLMIGAGLAALLALSHSILRYVTHKSPGLEAPAMLREHWLLLLVSVGIYGVVFVLYVLALRTEKMALLYPAYTGLSVILVAAAAVAFFGEAVRPVQLFGVVLIAAGVVAMGS